jgi:hypothetical protein
MARYCQHIKFEGMVTYQTSSGKVKLSITDKDTCAKLSRVVQDGQRTPFDDDTFQIVLTSRTKITSEIGKESVNYLPKLTGWRVVGKLKIKPYSFKSAWNENAGELITGVTLSCTEIHLGS